MGVDCVGAVIVVVSVGVVLFSCVAWVVSE